MLSVIICLGVFAAIAIRRIGSLDLPMWLSMTVGAVLVVLFEQITPAIAWQAISWPVIFYLFGAFVVAESLQQSQVLSAQLSKYLHKQQRVLWLFIAMIVAAAFLSALLMNDTVALLFAPLLLQVAKDLKQPAEPWLLALCFAVTIGSVCSPVGNPQNLLIAMHLNSAPFVTFLHYLLLPTVINIFILIVLFYIVYKKLWQHSPKSVPVAVKVDSGLGKVSLFALSLLVLLIIYKIISTVFAMWWQPSLAVIALVAAAPVILFSKRRLQVIKSIDWRTLVFFVAMFILMRAVWDAGVLQHLLQQYNLNLHHSSVIMLLSVVLSQLISNVPLVALYLPVLQHLHLGVEQFMALAGGSTLAGNFWILGAASNVIVLQAALKQKNAGFRISRFLMLGIPLGLINLLVLWLFLH